MRIAALLVSLIAALGYLGVAHAAEVWVNGTNCGARLWGPHVYAVGEALRPGPNEIRVRVDGFSNTSAITRPGKSASRSPRVGAARDGGNQGSEMQRARGGRCEAAPVPWHAGGAHGGCAGRRQFDGAVAAVRTRATVAEGW